METSSLLGTNTSDAQKFSSSSDEKASEIYDTIFLSITARHFRGDSGCFVSVCHETHEGLWDKAHRGRTAQPMFGMFNEPAIPVATQADWYLSALRRATGIVTDSCDDVSHSSHVCSGKVLCRQQVQRR